MKTEQATQARTSKAEKRRLYAIDNQYRMDLKEIAEALDVTTRQVRRYLETAEDCRTTESLKAEEYEEIRDLYNRGWTAAEIAYSENYSQSSIYRILRQTGARKKNRWRKKA